MSDPNASPAPATPCKPPKSLLGVQVVYVDKNGVVQCVWINLNAVDGITWCPAAPPPGKGKAPKGKPLPKGPPPPANCGETVEVAPQPVGPPSEKGGDVGTEGLPLGGDEPMCWWNGSNWECGLA